MLRTFAFIGALILSQTVAFAQQPCTTDARQVVDELYRHILERAADPGSAGHVQRLTSGDATVRDLVRDIVKSPEHQQRFLSATQGEANLRGVETLYRHVLGRQPDPAGARSYAGVAAAKGFGAVVDELIASPEYQQSFGDNGVPGSGGMTYCGANGQSRIAQPARQNPQAGRQDNPPDRPNSQTGRQGNPPDRPNTQAGRQDNQPDRPNSQAGRQDAQSDRQYPQSGRQDTQPDRPYPQSDRQYPGSDSMRFREMDRNNDGVITRGEWQGTRQSFDVHDWNGNGILSGDEVRAGARRSDGSVGDENFDRFDRFENLDVNRNGRIERNEWHGTREAFQWLDRNNDNVLSRSELLDNGGAVPTSGQRDRPVDSRGR